MEKLLFFIFLGLIPIQLGKHFWLEWSYVMGLRIDYLSPILYLTDVLFAGLVLVRVVVGRKVDIRRWWWWIVLMAAGILTASSKWLVVYGMIRIWQVAWLVGYIKKNKKITKGFLSYLIPWWISLQSLLGLAQVIKGGSIQGIFYWLGERRFSYSTIGTALVSVDGGGLVRAYGTFSHPNSLAGFLLVIMALWYEMRSRIRNIWWWAIWWLGVMGILITASRLIWFLFLVWMVVVFVRKQKDRMGMVVVFGCLVLALLSGYYINQHYLTERWLGGWDRESLSKRIDLNKSALAMVRDNPILGVGMGNFLVELPQYQDKIFLQPVHNVFLLWIAQTGILGIILTIWGLSKYGIKKIRIGVILIIIFSGMVDHYWLTLPQNYWLIGLVLGLI